ncbi:MAG: carboxypeptidase-like regulatory domain-containing protein, partial [Bacteroidota bacterium]
MKKLLYIFLAILCCYACRQDSEMTTITETDYEPPTIILEDYTPKEQPVTASVFGTVLNETGAPVIGAQITLGNNSAVSDETGNFIFTQVNMNQEGTYLEARFPGYFTGSTRFFPTSGSFNYLTIRLLERIDVGSFTSSEGGSITTDEGIQIEFPANAIIDAAGNSYTDRVTVFARWIDPEGEHLEEVMPGNLQGINRLNEDVALQTFGMMAVELESAEGAPLNLGNDQKANLTFPLSSALASNAPQEIPLWYFNETYGLWVEEGTASLQDNSYVGAVSHFSFWNCDAPFPLISITGRLVGPNNEPLSNTIVTIKVNTSGISRVGWTDINGVFSGKVPKDELLTIGVANNFCPTLPFIILLEDTFSENTDLGDLIVDGPATLVNLTASIVDCDLNPLTEAKIRIRFGNSDIFRTFYYNDPSNNPVNLTILNCSNESTLDIQVIDLVNLEQSELLNFTIVDGQVDAGLIEACGTPVEEFFKVTIDGLTTTGIDLSFYQFQNPDTTELRMFSSIPQVSSSVSFTPLSVGTFPGSVVKYMYLLAPSPAGMVSTSCSNLACGVTQVNILAFGSSGQPVIGNFSGMTTFIDSLEEPQQFPF